MKNFLLGFLGYPCLELLWRGRTHAAMALAGGICCHWIGKSAGSRENLFKRALAGVVKILGVEYGFGLLFNRRHKIWDYRGRKGHIGGQICPAYGLAWFALTLCGLKILDSMQPKNSFFR